MSALFCVSSFALAAPQDLLSGKLFIYPDGTSAGGLATDHNSGTALILGPAPNNAPLPIRYQASSTFNGKVADVTKIRVNFKADPKGGAYNGFRATLYDPNGTKVWEQQTNSGDWTWNVSLKNVAKVEITKTSNSLDSQLFDYEVWGDLNYAYPTNLVGTSDSKAAKLTWNTINDPDLTGYNVFQDGVKIGTSPTSNYVVTGLTPDKSYKYTVTAQFGGYETRSSNEVTVTAYDDLPDKPSITGDAKQDSILLKWSSARAISFYLFYVNGQLITVTSNNQYEVTGLDVNKVYSFYVVAYDKYGRSSYSDVVSFNTKAPPPPVAPTIKAVYRSYDTFDVSWDNVGMYYDVYLDGALLKQTTAMNFNFDQLKPDTDYEVKIVATDQYNQKAEGTLKVRTTSLPVIKKPTIKVSGKTWNSIDFYWDNVGTWYEVFLNGISVGQTVDLTWKLNNLTEDTDYTIKVVTTDAWGRLAEGVLKVKTDAIPKPADFKIRTVSVTKDSVRLFWNDVTGITSYDVFQDGQGIGNSNSTFYQVNSLTPDTSYSFYVSYVDQFGRTVKSNVLSVITPKPPTPPSGGGGSGGVIGNPNPPPPVSNSSNGNLNKANDKLVQGVDDMKMSSVKIIMLIIGVFIVVFFVIWIWRITKRNLSKANSKSAAGGSGSEKGNPAGGTTGSPGNKNVQGNYKATRTKNTKISPKMARGKMRLFNYDHGNQRFRQRKTRRY